MMESLLACVAFLAKRAREILFKKWIEFIIRCSLLDVRSSMFISFFSI